MPTPVLNREQATERILACASELRALGIARLALFGSVLRAEPRVDSAVDLLVQFMPGAKSYATFLAVAEPLEVRLGATWSL
jgi:uncharacterized protein